MYVSLTSHTPLFFKKLIVASLENGKLQKIDQKNLTKSVKNRQDGHVLEKETANFIKIEFVVKKSLLGEKIETLNFFLSQFFG